MLVVSLWRVFFFERRKTIWVFGRVLPFFFCWVWKWLGEKKISWCQVSYDLALALDLGATFGPHKNQSNLVIPKTMQQCWKETWGNLLQTKWSWNWTSCCQWPWEPELMNLAFCWGIIWGRSTHFIPEVQKSCEISPGMAFSKLLERFPFLSGIVPEVAIPELKTLTIFHCVFRGLGGFSFFIPNSGMMIQFLL